ncbi:MAG: membrane protein insertase YidC [Gemmatimonadaceae bacterium]
MDKRLSIALLLTALIVAVTPILFPTPRKAAVTPPSARVKDSSVAAAARVVTVVPPSGAAAVSAADTTARSDSGSPAAQEEFRLISTAKAVYRFSNLGASPVSATMKGYENLARKKGEVDLQVFGRALLTFALVLQRDTIKLDKTVFQTSMQAGDSTIGVTYSTAVAGRPVSISYKVDPGHYIIHVSGQVSEQGVPAYVLIGLPSTLPAVETDTTADIHALSYSFKPQRDNARGVPFAKLDPGEKKLEPGPLTWAAVKSKYFVLGIINPEGSAFEEMTLVGGARTSKLATSASATVVKAVKNDAFAFDIYAGPQQQNELLSVGRDFDHVNPYGWSFLQPVVNPIAALCIKLLLWMHEHLKLSYGWVLIIFGICIRIILWPLNQSAMRSSMKMQEIQPRLAEVQKRYKDNPDKQREEMMKVYKEANASPFTALSGCLPMLIPMPVLFALFFVFQNTIEFRGVPFLWLTDISVRDPIFILPVLMGISMYVLSWIGLRNAPPNPQAKMMSYMFPVMMTMFLANMASGLNLYYTAQNMASLPQQWLIARERAKARKPS